jgi:hypothetical protein
MLQKEEMPGIEAAAKAREDRRGYTLEAKVPWKLINPNFRPQPGDRIAFTWEVSIADDNPAEPRRIFQIFANGGGTWAFTTPGLWGEAVFNPPWERQTLPITHITAPIVVDGELNDWPKEAVKAEMALDPEAEDYRGTARLVWDEQCLYVAFEVASGKGLLNAGDDPSTAFKTGDTVEVFLSVNANPLADRAPRGPALDTAREGDYRVLMTLLRNTRPVVFGYDFVNPVHKENSLVLKMAGPKTLVDRSELIPGATLAVKAATFNDIGGYVAEAKLPWHYFRNYQPKPGARLLFNLAINFSNVAGTANMGKAYWNGPSHMTNDLGIEAQIHPENWGWLELK